MPRWSACSTHLSYSLKDCSRTHSCNNFSGSYRDWFCFSGCKLDILKSSVSNLRLFASWAWWAVALWLFKLYTGLVAEAQRPRTNVLAKMLLAMSTVNGTLPAHCNLLHYHSIFGAAFYIWCCLNIGLGAAIADPVHLVSPPMHLSFKWNFYYRIQENTNVDNPTTFESNDVWRFSNVFFIYFTIE